MSEKSSEPTEVKEGKIPEELDTMIRQFISKSIERSLLKNDLERMIERMILTLEVRRDGRITIPRAVRETLNIEDGDLLVISIRNVLKAPSRKKEGV